MAENEGISRFRKRWLTLGEAAKELATDVELLCQALTSGDLGDLPVYVHSGAGRFPGQMVFGKAQGPADGLPMDAEGYFTAWDREATDSGEWFWLTGTFRLSACSVKSIVGNKTLFGSIVSPISWSEPNSGILKYEDGQPSISFVLITPALDKTDPIFRVNNLRFRATDIASLKDESADEAAKRPSELSTQDSCVVNEKWPWGGHETQALGHLEAAAKQWWSRYDPTDSTTAHTNQQVADWLMKERGLSSRMAYSIASILRADGLPSGPRK